MRIGDLVYVAAKSDPGRNGVGLYLGRKSRGANARGTLPGKHYAFLWKGRVATFDKEYWSFSVIGRPMENMKEAK